MTSLLILLFIVLAIIAGLAAFILGGWTVIVAIIYFFKYASVYSEKPSFTKFWAETTKTLFKKESI